jgi:hypothetical protein
VSSRRRARVCEPSPARICVSVHASITEFKGPFLRILRIRRKCRTRDDSISFHGLLTRHPPPIISLILVLHLSVHYYS